MKRRSVEAVLVPLALLLFSLWYISDATSVSMNPHNIVFVLPLGILVSVILAAVVIREIIRARRLHEAHPTPTQTEHRDMKRSLLAMALFTVFVLSMEYVGYDVASLVFVSLMLYIFGERRIARIVTFSVVFTTVVLLFFGHMLPYPIPCLFMDRLLFL